MVILIKQ